MKVGDLVDVNQERGSGSYKHTIARGLGVIGASSREIIVSIQNRLLQLTH